MRGKQLGPYRILTLLGHGGMGKVYMAEVTEPVAGLEVGHTVALKVLHPQLQHEREALERFLEEARLGRRVQHENVVRTYDCDVAHLDGETHPYLVMEYVEGQTLRELVSELGRVPEGLCRHVGREVAKGLRAIHEVGVVHRDLKPDNVLITEKHVVKIMDLGVARLVAEASSDTQAGTFVGSISYASPEQIRGGGADVGAASDLHALGVLLYELATGESPYRHEEREVTVRRILEEEPRRLGGLNPQLSAYFEEVVHTLLAKEPADRLGSAHEAWEVLEQGELSTWWIRRASALRLETRRPLRRIRIPRDTQLYGREPELERLEGAWARARQGEGHVALIEGEAGIGKTRLIDEFVGRIQERGEDPNVLYGAYRPGGAATAAGAFSRAYREHFGAEGLEETIRAYLEPTPALAPSFAALLKGTSAPEGASPLTMESLQSTFVHATRALAAERPTIVVVEDLHFAPEDGRALFASLALAVAGHRVLLVGTMRRGVSEAWTAGVERHEHASRTVLERLGPADLVHLLEDAFRSTRLAEALGVKIALKSDGNPFFVFEIIRGLREEQAIAQRPDGTWITTRTILDLKVPSTVHDLVQARIEDLEDEERHLLEVASCCGFEFDGVLLAEAMGAERIPTFRRLGHLEQAHHLVRSVGRGFVFDHHQVQETLYEGLSPVLREEYHRVIGQALERREGATEQDPRELDGSVAVDLCEHFLAADVAESARRYLDAALDHLERGYVNEHAARLAARVLDVPDLLRGRERVDVLLRRTNCLDLLGWRSEQEAAAREAVAVAREEADGALQARALSRLAAALGVTMRFEEAAHHLEEARALARIARDRWEEGRAAGNLGIILAHQGRHADALPLFEHVLAMARETGERTSEMRGLGNLGTTLLALGRLQEARTAFESQLALARNAGDVRSEAFAAGCVGTVLLRTGRHADALEYFERQRDLDRAVGDRRGESVAHGLLAGALVSVGRYAEAQAHAEQQLEIAQDIEDRWSEGRATAVLANVASDLGRYAEARVRTRAWLDMAREIGDRVQEGWALHALGQLADVQGQGESALRHLDDALAVRRSLSDVFGEAADHLLRARIRERQGDEAGAREELESALADARECEAPGVRVVAAAHRAVLGAGTVDEALAELRDAEARSTIRSRLEARWLLWRLTEDPVHLAEAHRLLDWIREHAPASARSSVIENVVLHRDLVAAWRDHGDA